MALVSERLDLELDGIAREWARKHFGHRPKGWLSHTTGHEQAVAILESGIFRMGDLKNAAPEQEEVEFCTDEVLSVARQVRELRPHAALDALLEKHAILDIVRNSSTMGCLCFSEKEHLFSVFGDVSLRFDGPNLSRELFMQSLWLNRVDYDIDVVRAAVEELIHALLDAFEQHADADPDDPDHIGFLSALLQEAGARQCFAPRDAPKIEQEWRAICGVMVKKTPAFPFGSFDLRLGKAALRDVLISPACHPDSRDRIGAALERNWPDVAVLEI